MSDGDQLGLEGWFTMQCIGPDGEEKWVERYRNTVVTVGKNIMLDSYLSNTTYAAAFRVGLKGTGTVSAADTLASHAGWAELTSYSGSRPAPAFSSAASGSKTMSAPAAFAITGTMTVTGSMIVHGGSATPGETATGTLFSAGDFSVSRSVANGDTLNVTYTLAM
jgi:hypothetical protein